MPQTNKTRYPWDEWFAKPSFKIVRGKDYQCMTHGMIGQIRNYAAAHNLSIEIRAKGDTLTVTNKGER